MSTIKILMIHGLESGVLGKKAAYLRNHFGEENVVVPAMETGTLNFSKNSFFMHGIYNLGSVLSGHYYETIAHSTLDSGVKILKDLMSSNTFDIVIGSSMGGAIITEALAREGQLFKCPILLLAPALKKVRNKFNVSDDVASSSGVMTMSTMYAEINKYRAENGKPKLIVVHGVLDDVVPIVDSKELVANIDGSQLIEVPDGDHSLNNYLLDGNVVANGVTTERENKFETLIRSIVQNM